MSVIQEPGSTRPGRAAGLLLIGIAVIAVVLGVITLLNGGEDKKPNSSPTSSAQPQPTSRTSATQPNSNLPPQSTGQASPPVTTTTVAAPPPAFDPKQVPVRVFNNSTIAKFAAQAAQDFRNDGWNVVEVGNYSETNIPTSTAYFSQGNAEEEAAAKALAAKFNVKAAARLPNFRYGPGVVVMVTKDYGSK
jgi:LytR cell envelope-related transcriptional attenuator